MGHPARLTPTSSSGAGTDPRHADQKILQEILDTGFRGWHGSTCEQDGSPNEKDKKMNSTSQAATEFEAIIAFAHYVKASRKLDNVTPEQAVEIAAHALRNLDSIVAAYKQCQAVAA